MVLNEVVKLCFAMAMLLIGFKIRAPIKPGGMIKHLTTILFCKECLLMAVPGFLYFLMNQLAFVGLENLEASTYALVSQLKILTTALFARLLLSQKLWWHQWRALLLLVIGVVLVQAQPGRPQVATQPMPSLTTNSGVLEIAGVALTTDHAHLSRNNGTLEVVAPLHRMLLQHQPTSDGLAASAAAAAASASFDDASSDDKGSVFVQFKGLIATALAAVLSGLSGCYVEKMMKGGTLSVWDRNVQLAVYGILFGMGQIILFSSDADRAYAASNGWLGGYSVLACFVVLLNSLGGILVSLVVVYLDNIIRGFATSVAILLTAFISYAVFHDVQITTVFSCGVVTVLLSVLNYQDPMQATPAEHAAMLPSPGASPLLLPVSNSASTNVTPSGLGRSISGGGSGGGGNGSVELQGVSVHRYEVGSGVPSGGMTRSRSAILTPSPLAPEEEDEEAALLSR